MKNLTLSLLETTKRLSEAGFKIGYDKLRAGIIAGVFDFAVSFETGNAPVFVIYAKDLEKFIEQHGGKPIEC